MFSQFSSVLVNPSSPARSGHLYADWCANWIVWVVCWIVPERGPQCELALPGNSKKQLMNEKTWRETKEGTDTCCKYTYLLWSRSNNRTHFRFWPSVMLCPDSKPVDLTIRNVLSSECVNSRYDFWFCRCIAWGCVLIVRFFGVVANVRVTVGSRAWAIFPQCNATPFSV